MTDPRLTNRGYGVAGGLDVAPGADHEVHVDPGMAVDQRGRIVRSGRRRRWRWRWRWPIIMVVLGATAAAAAAVRRSYFNGRMLTPGDFDVEQDPRRHHCSDTAVAAAPASEVDSARRARRARRARGRAG